MLKLAIPLARLTVARTVVPSSKTTEPLGVPEPGLAAVTAALMVTCWPNSDGFVTVGGSESVTTVLSWLTV